MSDIVVDESLLRAYMLEQLRTKAPSGLDVRPQVTPHSKVLTTSIGQHDYKMAISTLIAANGGRLGDWPRDWVRLPVDDLIPHILEGAEV